MSIHYLERSGEVRMQPPTRKLVFMAICDDAEKTGGLSMPGIEKVMAWAGCGRTQAMEHIAALIEAGYIERVSKGRRGSRAVYRVFARVACCAEHPVTVESGEPDANDGLGETATGSDEPNAIDAIEDSTGSGQPDAIEAPLMLIESGQPDPKPADSPVRVRKGSGLDRTPSSAPEVIHPPTGGDARVSARARLAAGERTTDVLIGLWLEHRGDRRPPKRIVGQVAKLVKEFLDDDGIPFEIVRLGLGRWDERNLGTNSLPGFVDEAQKGANVRAIQPRQQYVDPNIAALNPAHFGGGAR